MSPATRDGAGSEGGRRVGEDERAAAQAADGEPRRVRHGAAPALRSGRVAREDAVAPAPLGLGVIEGFFGPQWRWTERAAYARFLADHGFAFYLFAPKRCAALRRRWDAPWPAEEWRRLVSLRERYREAGVAFGVGLSPYALYRRGDAGALRSLHARIETLNRLDLDLLGILFDDMPAEVPDLARRQCRIVERVRDASNAGAIALCPTYYSDDAALDAFSGPRPAQYLETLGAELAPPVHVFWTGPEVCSAAIGRHHLEELSERLGRPVLLWDNYPVNDGPRMSRRLHLRAFAGRSDLPAAPLSGHGANPMNAPYLSQIPLATLAMLYADPGGYEPRRALARALERLCDDTSARCLLEDVERLQDVGLDGLGPAERQALRRRYRALDNPFADEVVAWLDGAYAPTPEDLAEFGQG